MSHELPEPDRTRLQRLASAIDEGLQAETHTVSSAMAQNEAFDQRWVEADLTRAVIARLACAVDIGGLLCQELSNGGVEVATISEEVERRYRLRRAVLDRFGRPVVTVNSDSILNPARRDPNLFGDPPPSPPKVEQWVLAYVLDPRTRTFSIVYAARVVGVNGSQPPYRLKLADVVEIPFSAPLPPGFKPDRDDLEMPDEEEGLGEPDE